MPGSYNKNEKDFTTRREYNDYLEEAEDLSRIQPVPPLITY